MASRRSDRARNSSHRSELSCAPAAPARRSAPRCKSRDLIVSWTVLTQAALRSPPATTYATVTSAQTSAPAASEPAADALQHFGGAPKLTAQNQEAAGPDDRRRQPSHRAPIVVLEEIADSQEAERAGPARHRRGPTQNARTSDPSPALPFHHQAAARRDTRDRWRRRSIRRRCWRRETSRTSAPGRAIARRRRNPAHEPHAPAHPLPSTTSADRVRDEQDQEQCHVGQRVEVPRMSIAGTSLRYTVGVRPAAILPETERAHAVQFDGCMRRILVTNDDGYFSTGLDALADALRAARRGDGCRAADRGQRRRTRADAAPAAPARADPRTGLLPSTARRPTASTSPSTRC